MSNKIFLICLWFIGLNTEWKGYELVPRLQEEMNARCAGFRSWLLCETLHIYNTYNERKCFIKFPFYLSIQWVIKVYVTGKYVGIIAQAHTTLTLFLFLLFFDFSATLKILKFFSLLK